MAGSGSELFKRPETTQEAVLAELRKSIVAGVWQPGEPIRQEAVASQFGVSRVPVREALKILEGEGQVQYRAHHGYVLTDLDRDDLKEIYRVRKILERAAIEEGIPNLTEARFEIMAAAMETMESTPLDDPVTLTEAHREFHFAIFAAGSGKRLCYFLRLLWDATGPYRAVYYRDYMNQAVLDRINLEHRKVYDMIRHAAPLEEILSLLDDHRGQAVDGILTSIEQRVQ